MASEVQKINRSGCPICFKEELSSPQIVYSSCCFQRVCNVCDQMLNKCAHCRAALGELRIRFGALRFDMENSSNLRLSPKHNTINSVISAVKKFLPLMETVLENPLTMKLRHPNGDWSYPDNNEITNENEYYLERVRLPHIDLTDSEVDRWIGALLGSGKRLTQKPLTKEEIHRKCKSYADRISPSPLSQEYINSRMQVLVENGFCELDGETDTYHSLA